jgi:hypothetical protein
MPKRIQRQTSPGWRKPANTIYVGNGSPWANPFCGKRFHEISRDLVLRCPYAVQQAYTHTPQTMITREISLPLYEQWLLATWTYAELHKQLGGKNIMDWTPTDQASHADILLRLANDERFWKNGYGQAKPQFHKNFYATQC